MMTIGDRIRYRREELGYSQDELARRLGYKSRSSINKIEKDASGLPQTKIAAIASALNTTPSYIMGWEETQKKNDTLSDIILKMNEDEELFEMVVALSKLGFEKREAVKSVLNAFSVVDK